MASCSLSRNVKILSECVERKDICLHVVKCKNKSVKYLKWIIDLLVKHKSKAPKIVLFCRSVQLAGWLYEKNLYCDELPQEDIRKMVTMFHSTTLQHHKRDCLSSQTDPDHPTRLVIATSALGCGVDMKNINYVVHFGPSYDTVDYVQQIGRAGRSNMSEEQSYAILYVYPGSLRKVSSNMNQYVQEAAKHCQRVKLYAPFSPEEELKPLKPGHRCCSYCSKICTCCDGCSEKTLLFKVEEELPDNDDHVVVRKVLDHHRSAVKQCLIEYHDNSRPQCSIIPVKVVSGISHEIIEKNLENLPFISSVNFITSNLSIANEQLAHEIIVIINEVFDENIVIEDISDANFASVFEKQITFDEEPNFD